MSGFKSLFKIQYSYATLAYKITKTLLPTSMESRPHNNNNSRPYRKQNAPVQNGDTFTHFVSIPFIAPGPKSSLKFYQDGVLNCFDGKEKQALRRNNPDLFHITLCMLSLNESKKQKVQQIMKNLEKPLVQLFLKVSPLKCQNLGFFKRGNHPNPFYGITVLYLHLHEENDCYRKIALCADLVIREFVKEQIVDISDFKSMNIHYDHNKGLYVPDKMHITMFRVDSRMQGLEFETGIKEAQKIPASFQLEVECVDISTRGEYDKTNFYAPLSRISVNGKN